MTSSSMPPARACCCAASAPADRSGPIDGRFDLVDHHGRPVNERSFGDRLLLVFFGFSHCAVVCPRELAKLGAALERLGPLADRVQPLYVSVDPRRDDPATLKAHLARYPGRFLGLTGTAEQVAAAKAAYRVFAEPVVDPGAPGGYVVPHTAFAYLMAPGGHYRAHLSDSLDADAVVERLRTHLS